jgi:RHS repeat-associated protein
MPGRKMNASDYRFGFGGHEKDDEVHGVTGSHLSFGDMGYDPRIVRRWRPDPLQAGMPSWSPYAYALDNPIMFVDEDGKWPGVTFFYFEFDAGLGIGYGLNYVEQSGLAYDEVGKTHFTMTSAIYIINQNLEDGSDNPELVMGASISITGNIKQNWGSETFAGMLSKGNSSIPLPIGKGGAGLAVNIGFAEDEFTLGAGLGIGLKFTHLNTSIKHSISLTDEEADIVNDATDVWNESWSLTNKQQIVDDEGNITGFEASVSTFNTEGELINTGIKVYSGAMTNDEGEVESTGVWSSKAYQNAATKAEKEDG